jgi:hypothetical protein
MKQGREPWQVLAALMLMGLAWSAQAQTEAIGYVKNVTGDAWVTSAGQRVKATPGSAVMLGSKLQTGATASLGVNFKDDTQMSFGPDTELTVDEYLYEPANKKLGFSTRLVRGTLNFVSGVIAKLKPDSVSIKTPTGVIGVRGTQFVVRVDPDEEAQ